MDCRDLLSECTAAVRDRTATADHLELQRSTCDLLDARPVIIMMIGRASFIGLIPRRWITIAATQWQFLATFAAVHLLASRQSVRTTLNPSFIAIANMDCALYVRCLEFYGRVRREEEESRTTLRRGRHDRVEEAFKLHVLARARWSGKKGVEATSTTIRNTHTNLKKFTSS